MVAAGVWLSAIRKSTAVLPECFRRHGAFSRLTHRLAALTALAGDSIVASLPLGSPTLRDLQPQ